MTARLIQARDLKKEARALFLEVITWLNVNAYMTGSSILGLKRSIQEVEKARRKAAKRVKKEEDSP